MDKETINYLTLYYYEFIDKLFPKGMFYIEKIKETKDGYIFDCNNRSFFVSKIVFRSYTREKKLKDILK